MQRLALTVALVSVVAFGMGMAADGAEKPAPIKVLLIGGDDVTPYHDWHEIAEKTREALLLSGRFEVKVCEEPLILESKKALARYDVIVLTMYNSVLPTISDPANEIESTVMLAG